MCIRDSLNVMIPESAVLLTVKHLEKSCWCVTLVVTWHLIYLDVYKRQEQDEQIAAASQTVNMLIIDKKRMKLKDAGLPQQIIEQLSLIHISKV